MPVSRALSSITYISRSLVDEPGIERINITANRNNKERQITGALIWTGGYFVQVLEGPLVSVVAAFRLMNGDLRHCNLRVLEQGKIDERRFGDWAMATVIDTTADTLIEKVINSPFESESFKDLRRQTQNLIKKIQDGRLRIMDGNFSNPP